ncbi:hypothetical protein JTB14_002837 [Gonioctena quinquepunctata]|nr:hypothetical protein JTB14_002837 [Gonioctena quinquepunctata]
MKLKVQSRNDPNHTPDTGTETDEIILNPGDDVDWVNQILGHNHSVELLIVNDNSEPENHTPTTANELLHMDENTNLNNAELNVANENEHFMITQDKIDEILPNGVAAAIVVENVNNNHIENNEPISSMINLSQTATENDIKENSYVVVCYDNQYYPGIIVELDGDDVRVKAMVRSGPTGWKWPTPDDVIWYSRSDLMEIIEQPNFAAVNKRGAVAEPRPFIIYYSVLLLP